MRNLTIIRCALSFVPKISGIGVPIFRQQSECHDPFVPKPGYTRGRGLRRVIPDNAIANKDFYRAGGDKKRYSYGVKRTLALDSNGERVGWICLTSGLCFGK